MFWPDTVYRNADTRPLTSCTTRGGRSATAAMVVAAASFRARLAGTTPPRLEPLPPAFWPATAELPPPAARPARASPQGEALPWSSGSLPPLLAFVGFEQLPE